jgi:hypothetical protein
MKCCVISLSHINATIIFTYNVGFGVWGLGFGVWGLGFGVWGLGFGVWGLGFGVWGLGFSYNYSIYWALSAMAKLGYIC